MLVHLHHNLMIKLNVMNVLVSACLLGVPCRYDAASKANEKVLSVLKNPVFNLIPVCPEILGGLPTPRPPCEIKGGRVITENGEDRTGEYQKGAEEVLRLSKMFRCKFAILKENSPSCGSNKIYDGTFLRKLTDGNGMTAKLLKENGITVFGESNLDELDFDLE